MISQKFYYCPIGTEFMCDLCELVFTSKEKLDNHITNAHEDELRSEVCIIQYNLGIVRCKLTGGSEVSWDHLIENN